LAEASHRILIVMMVRTIIPIAWRLIG
jgi:hypothetical protein